MLTSKRIIKAIAEKYPEEATHLSLCRAKDYCYFVYDDGTAFEDHSVSVARLNHLSLEGWVSEGTQFLESIK